LPVAILARVNDMADRNGVIRMDEMVASNHDFSQRIRQRRDNYTTEHYDALTKIDRERTRLVTSMVQHALRVDSFATCAPLSAAAKSLSSYITKLIQATIFRHNQLSYIFTPGNGVAAMDGSLIHGAQLVQI